MLELRVSSFGELHEVVQEYSRPGDAETGWFYRGQADASWPVVPKAGRPEYILGNDLHRFKAWKKAAVAYTVLPDNDWECMAIAQHHGLATRLLDWTRNPLAAAFFASCESPEVDGALYCYFPGWHLNPDSYLRNKGINDNDMVLAYSPRHLIPRIVNQGGVFTAHPRPSQPLGEAIVEQAENFHADPATVDKLVQVIITAEAKSNLLNDLDRYGVSYVSLFPDLDGLSRHINRHTLRNISDKLSRIANGDY